MPSRSRIIRYVLAVVGVAASAVVGMMLQSALGYRFPLITFYPAIMLSAWYGGLWPGILSTATSAAVVDFLWLAPLRQAQQANAGDFVALVLFGVIGILISGLSESLHRSVIREHTARTQSEDREGALGKSERNLRASESRLTADATALAQLNALSSRLWRLRSQSEGLEEMLAATIELLGADMGNIQLFDPERHVLTIAAQRGFSHEFLDFFREVSAEDDSACGRALRTGERMVVEDVDIDALYAPLRAIARTADYRGVLSTPLMNRGGQPLGVLSTHWRLPHRPTDQELARLDLYARQAADFIERCRTEGALEESSRRLQLALDELQAASRLKDEFLATLSHELRTPLNAVLGWAQMLRTGTLRPDAEDRAFESLERNARAQAQLVDDLLDMSRIISGKLRIDNDPVNLASVIAEAVDTARSAATRKVVTLQVSIERADGITVTGDGNRLRQILSNLVLNAVKFTPAEGRVDVALSCDDSEARIVVRDTGEGIEPQFLPFVFERFRQADAGTTKRYGGLGLGLAIVKHLTEAHGGVVTAESEGLGKGATFTVRLPLAATRMEPRHVARGSRAISKRLRGVHVLVVDDDPDARDLLRAVLESQGARVSLVESAREALEAVRAAGFDALLSDIAMPEHDGLWLIRAIRSLPSPERRLPAVAVTAYAGLSERDIALAAGYSGHVAKPVDADQLVTAIADALGADRGAGVPN